MGTQSSFTLRMPLSLKNGAEQIAREDGSTLNQFILSAVPEKLRQLKRLIIFCSMRRQNGKSLSSNQRNLVQHNLTFATNRV